LVAAAFLTRSQPKDVAARSIVQDSAAPAWLRAAARDFPTLAASDLRYSRAAELSNRLQLGGELANRGDRELADEVPADVRRRQVVDHRPVREQRQARLVGHASNDD
jgi:hypothetical protein